MIKPKVGVKVVSDNSQLLVAGMDFMMHHRLLVGWPESTKARQEMEVQSVQGRRKVAVTGPAQITNAALAYIHDNGSPIRGIPAREFLRPGIVSVKDRIADRLEKVGKAALAGNTTAAEEQLHAAGLIAVSGVRNKITMGPFVPLRPATLAARKRKGFRGTKPLIVTGQLRNSCSYVLEKA